MRRVADGRRAPLGHRLAFQIVDRLQEGLFEPVHNGTEQCWQQMHRGSAHLGRYLRATSGGGIES